MSKNNFDQSTKNPSGTLFIGVDIAKKKNYAAPVCGRDNRVGKSVGFKNNRKGFNYFYKRIGKWCRRYNLDAIEIGMEPTASYWEPLYYWLRSLGFNVNPPLPQYFAESPSLLGFCILQVGL